MIGIIRRDRGASALIYTTRSCGETRSLFFCQNRSEQNSLAMLGCAGMPATRRTRGRSTLLNNTRGAAATAELCAADVAVGPERTPAAPPRERISADGDRAKAGDLVMFERFTPPDGGTEVENGSGTVLSDEDRSSMRGVWIETGRRRKAGGSLNKTWVPRRSISEIIHEGHEMSSPEALTFKHLLARTCSPRLLTVMQEAAGDSFQRKAMEARRRRQQ